MITGVDHNPFITTATGIRFHLVNPSSLEISVVDIAQGLSRQPRFAGHTSEPWSVAEHCLLVTAILRHNGFNARMQMAGLLHDAAEAYICDVPSPLKWAMTEIDGKECAYRQIEARVEQVITIALQPSWLGAPEYARQAVKTADQIALLTEAKAFIPMGGTWTVNEAEAYFQSPRVALDTLRVKLCIAKGLSVMETYLMTYDLLLAEEVGF
jgi:5'-deoxynucleotidase YfbR-like HD superfamily hydrolase